ncbi:MAG TPA: TonB-dependent receptor [Novosphingobium sp.]|nr:TonB-dependent receptor [Novosphingobium sp.]
MKKAFIGVLLATTCLPMAVFAQAGDPVGATSASSSSDTVGMQDIIVTARRREESLSHVPASIAALDASQLVARGITTEADLQSAVPGLTLREGNTSNQLNYAIRGQTVDAFTSSQPGVLPYINEVQITSNNATSLYDLGGVQVLKGPQGTLFGRNATGGAVLFQTASPTENVEARAMARIGNFDHREVELMGNLPVVEGTVLLRVAGNLVRRDGYIRNILTGEKLGTQKNGSGRVSLLLQPGDRFRNTTVIQYSHIGGTTASGPVYSINPCGSSTQGLNDSAVCAYSAAFLPPGYTAANPQTAQGFPAFFEKQKARGPFIVEFNSPSYISGKAYFVTNNTTLELNDDLLIKNVAGAAYNRSHYSMDGDRSPFNIYSFGVFGPLASMRDLTTGQFQTTKQWSEELQLQGKAFSGQLEYIVGGYYSYQSQEQDFNQVFFDFSPVAAGGGAYIHTITFNRSKAVFAQGNLDLAEIVGVEGLKLTAGGRYTWERVRVRQLPRAAAFGLPPLQTRFKKPSWTVGLDYQVSPELLLYAAHRGSFRSGGFNAAGTFQPGPAATGGAEFAPETTTDVELGAKFNGDFSGVPFRANVALYRQRVENVQRAAFALVGGGIANLTVNVPEAVIKGVEFDVNLRPAEWLTIGGAGAYTHAKFTKNSVNLFGTVIPFGPYPDVPKWAGSVFAEIALPMDERMGDLTLRGDLYAQSGFYFSSTGDSITPGTKLPSYETANFRLDWSNIAGSGVGAAVYVNNAFDEVYYTGGVAVGNLFGYNNANPARPRMYGVELRFKY